MELTLEKAATKLGKSVRQVRYLVKEGRIPSRKVAGRWFVQVEDAPKSPGQQAAAGRKQKRLRAVVEDALGLKPSEAQRYSVQNLQAFQIGLPCTSRLARSWVNSTPGRRRCAKRWNTWPEVVIAMTKMRKRRPIAAPATQRAWRSASF